MENAKTDDQINQEIETVTPDTNTEKPDLGKPTQENSPKSPGSDADETKDEAPHIEQYEEAKHEPLPGQQNGDHETDNADKKKDEPAQKSHDPGDDIETVSP